AHAHVEGAVVLDPLLTAEAVPDGGLDVLGELQHGRATAGHTGTGEDRDLLGGVDVLGQPVHHLRVGGHAGLRHQFDLLRLADGFPRTDEPPPSVRRYATRAGTAWRV